MGLPGSLVKLQEIKAEIVASQYTSAAAATLFLYDILLTFNDEIELVWKRNLFTFPTILYFCNRYVGFATVLFMTYKSSAFHAPFSDFLYAYIINKSIHGTNISSSCKVPVGMIGFVIGAVSWSGILTLRVSALWRSNKFVVWAVWLSWGAFVFLATGAAVLIYLSILPTLEYSEMFGICIAFTDSSILSATPYMEAGFVLIHTFLTAVKAYQFSSASCGKACTLVNVLLKDGIGYFFVVAFFSIAATISWNFLPSARLFMLITLNWTVFSILVSRLFLRLRRMFYVREEDTDGMDAISLYSNRKDVGLLSGLFGTQFLTNAEFGMLSLPEIEPQSDIQSPSLPSRSLPALPLPILSLSGTLNSQTTLNSRRSTHYSTDLLLSQTQLPFTQSSSTRDSDPNSKRA